MSLYRMPAEWEPHEATWLAWPHLVAHWPGKFETIPPVYAEIIRALIQFEKVHLCVNDEAMEKSAREVLKKAGVSFDEHQLRFFHIPTDASWARDHGPIFVRDTTGKLTISKWTFNAWGDQWPHEKDEKVPMQISEKLNIPIVKTGMVLEGGSIDVNGKGTLMTTTQCLLNKDRNPEFTQKQIEQHLHDYLGITNILWLGEGIVGDDTSGHIDDIARFVDPHTIVCGLEENKNDENYEALKKNYEALKNMKDQDGKPFKVIPLPMPDPVFYENKRLPASYANFYFANGALLVPTFRGKQDQEAIKIFKELLPDRKIIGIDCTDLVWGFGTLHCSTQQQPKK